MIPILLVILSSLGFSKPAATLMFIPRCTSQDKSECGSAYLEKGWRKIAECGADHEWHYIIEKSKKDLKLKCSGFRANKGPEERPCKPFKGHLEEFKTCSQFKDLKPVDHGK